jgi:hypothetical protein
MNGHSRDPGRLVTGIDLDGAANHRRGPMIVIVPSGLAPLAHEQPGEFGVTRRVVRIALDPLFEKPDRRVRIHRPFRRRVRLRFGADDDPGL